MTDILQNKIIKANELRRKGEIAHALPLYKELWENTHDKFAVAGLLFCLRRQKNFDEAIPLAEEAYSKFPDFDWCRNEYIWTLIQGKLYLFSNDGELSNLISIVNKILEAKPDEIAFKVTILKLLKIAKKQENWDVLNEWITRISPDILDGYTKKSTGWTERELWYYYRVNGLIHSHNEEEAITIIENNRNEFYKQKMFFERVKAIALINLKKYDEAEVIYKALTFPEADWYLFHEYGNLLLKQNKVEKALINFIKASLKPPMKPKLKVSLFSDTGNLLIRLDKKEQALLHFRLAKAIREEQNWSIGDLNEKIDSCKGHAEKNEGIKSLINKCRAIWQEYIGKEETIVEEKIQTKNLKGKVINLNNNKPFCFIKTKDNNSFFCSKDDLPKGVNNMQIVKFDLKPSFDKKKNKETYKAVNVQLCDKI